jgi:D-alanyl-D-alanine carboxypeptidase
MVILKHKHDCDLTQNLDLIIGYSRAVWNLKKKFIIFIIMIVACLIFAERLNLEEGIVMLRDQGIEASAAQNSEDWMIILVNKDTPLPLGYKPPLASLSNGLQFDARAIDSLNMMLSQARAEGLSPVVCSAYRSVEYQRQLFDNQISKQMSRGLDPRQAELEAGKVVAYPGTSEHNLGLAVDIVSLHYQILDDAQADTPEIKWITEHCSEYGFILRYPKDKTNVTGIIYEPWHFRYVGIDAAKAITESGYCLEEYVQGK